MATPAPPGFTVTPVPNRTRGGLVGADTLGLILHVQAGDGALAGWFSNPAAQASSTWWAGKRGQREQYGDPDRDKFWAQADGNRTYHSIETEGQPSQALTPEQIESVAVAYAWGHVRYGWPFQLAEKPGQPGLGWHGMGGAAWGNHPYCPGNIRKAQRAAILARAQQITTGTNQEDDMPYTPQQLRDEVAAGVLGAEVGRTGVTVGVMLDRLYQDMRASSAREAALTAALEAVATSQGSDPATVAAVVDKAVRDRLAQLAVVDNGSAR